MDYVVLFYGDDGALGQTVGPINGWDNAVAMGVRIAESRNEPLAGEALDHFNETGDARTPSGAIHIGGLTSDLEE